MSLKFKDKDGNVKTVVTKENLKENYKHWGDKNEQVGVDTTDLMYPSDFALIENRIEVNGKCISVIPPIRIYEKQENGEVAKCDIIPYKVGEETKFFAIFNGGRQFPGEGNIAEWDDFKGNIPGFQNTVCKVPSLQDFKEIGDYINSKHNIGNSVFNYEAYLYTKDVEEIPLKAVNMFNITTVEIWTNEKNELGQYLTIPKVYPKAYAHYYEYKYDNSGNKETYDRGDHPIVLFSQDFPAEKCSDVLRKHGVPVAPSSGYTLTTEHYGGGFEWQSHNNDNFGTNGYAKPALAKVLYGVIKF